MRHCDTAASLSKNGGCASETSIQAFVKSAPVEPRVQETGIKGVATPCAIHDIDLSCFAEKTFTPEIGFCTCIAQCRYHPIRRYACSFDRTDNHVYGHLCDDQRPADHSAGDRSH